MKRRVLNAATNKKALRQCVAVCGLRDPLHVLCDASFLRAAYDYFKHYEKAMKSIASNKEESGGHHGPRHHHHHHGDGSKPQRALVNGVYRTTAIEGGGGGYGGGASSSSSSSAPIGFGGASQSHRFHHQHPSAASSHKVLRDDEEDGKVFPSLESMLSAALHSSKFFVHVLEESRHAFLLSLAAEHQLKKTQQQQRKQEQKQQEQQKEDEKTKKGEPPQGKKGQPPAATAPAKPSAAPPPPTPTYDLNTLPPQVQRFLNLFEVLFPPTAPAAPAAASTANDNDAGTEKAAAKKKGQSKPAKQDGATPHRRNEHKAILQAVNEAPTAATASHMKRTYIVAVLNHDLRRLLTTQATVPVPTLRMSFNPGLLWIDPPTPQAVAACQQHQRNAALSKLQAASGAIDLSAAAAEAVIAASGHAKADRAFLHQLLKDDKSFATRLAENARKTHKIGSAGKRAASARVVPAATTATSNTAEGGSVPPQAALPRRKQPPQGANPLSMRQKRQRETFVSADFSSGGDQKKNASTGAAPQKKGGARTE